MSLAYITHPACALHSIDTGHPESPARLAAINDRLIASGLDALVRHYEAPAASREQLTRVHTAAYVDEIFARAPDAGRVWLDPDTAMTAHTLEAALHAAGAAVLGVDLVMRGKVDSAFCAVRPPGHHAERDRAMGFCLFNNVAVGAAHALATYGLERVAIVDFDVHHGNGTENIFAEEPRVLLCSSFQHPFYPHSGADTHNVHILNLPLPAGTNGAGFRAVYTKQGLPALNAFRPQLLLISAGFDAHIEDEMAGLALTEADYSWITTEIHALAERHAKGRIVSCLEGGYALSALGRSVCAHLDALLG